MLAASINNDAIAVVRKLEEPFVKVMSDGYNNLIMIQLEDLEKKIEEEGSTNALIRGVLAKMKMNGYLIGGFQAYVTSEVLIGAGLSSSAAFETLIGTILSYLYNDGKVTPIEIAKIGQYAENVYFGKPCGLMDQMACSVGSLVHIDFADPENPIVEQVDFDMNAYGYSLCITDTKGSHADLTPDYAAIPQEMKQAAKCFGKEFLGEVPKEEVLSHITLIRELAGDRAALRALHFVCENERVKKEVDALRKDNFPEFLANVKESGDSSFKYLQNVYTCHDVQHQNVAIALALSDVIFEGKGVCRVHGGGFAGTIQAFVPNYLVSNYQKEMDPHTEYHHIKKENIGLIEVMGLAVLPARLKKEMAELEQAILNHEDLRQNETVAAHAEWAEGWIPKYKITDSNIHSIIQKEIGIVFAKVLEDAGVYKRTDEGKAAFKRFIESL